MSKKKKRNAKVEDADDAEEPTCKLILCEDKKTGRLVARYGQCNADEVARLTDKLVNDGVDLPLMSRAALASLEKKKDA